MIFFGSKYRRLFWTLTQTTIKPMKLNIKSDSDYLKMSSTEDTLIFANVIFRHGDRNITTALPNDPYKDESQHWPEGFFQLTKVGMQRTYKLGQYLRRRYNHILGDRYSKNKVYVQSSDTDRTLMSAQSCLAGLFFPTEDEKWSNDILWRPVPVHTIPRKLDNVIAIERDETYVALHKKHCAESKEVKRIFTEYADHIAYWSKMSGINLSSLDRIHLLYDTFEIEKEQNKKIPEWAEKAIEPGGIMEYISRFCYKLYSGTPKLVQISFGYLLNEMLEHFVQKASGTLKPDRVLWLYSAHDYSIFNALNGLGMLNELHIPPYASSLHFELYKRSDNSHYVQIFYRRSEEEHPPSMIIPGHGEKCSLDEFIDLCKPIIPDDIDAKSHL